jgi:hypothetical protein
VGEEVHVLTPTRYGKPVKGNRKAVEISHELNEKAVGVNRDLVLGPHTGDTVYQRVSGDGGGDWERGRREAGIVDQGGDEEVMG